MSELSLLEINQSQLDKTPAVDGRLIVCLDTGNAYRDSKSEHYIGGSWVLLNDNFVIDPMTNDEISAILAK